MEMQMSVADFYAALTEHVDRPGGNATVLHRGLWGPDTTTHRESLQRAKHTLVQGCDLDPGRHVLDAGCGLGATAIWLAEAYRVRVTGLSNCAPHVEVAARHAERRGLGHLVEFRCGDFMALPFPDASFDAVLNHESLCYAEDKLAYLQGVYRVLKPGGRLQALEGLLSGAPMSEEQQALHAAMQQAWRIPPLEPWRNVLATLEEAGFEDIRDRDLSAEAARSRETFRKSWPLLAFINPQFGELDRAVLEFMEGAFTYAQGLHEGAFVYRFVSGARPVQSSPTP